MSTEEQPNFEGHEGRECGEHRTVGPHRAWCYDCSEWCYPGNVGECRGCRLPMLEAKIAAQTEQIEQLTAETKQRAEQILDLTAEADRNANLAGSFELGMDEARAALAAEREKREAAEADRDEIEDKTPSAQRSASYWLRAYEAERQKVARVEAAADENAAQVAQYEAWAAELADSGDGAAADQKQFTAVALDTALNRVRAALSTQEDHGWYCAECGVVSLPHFCPAATQEAEQ